MTTAFAGTGPRRLATRVAYAVAGVSALAATIAVAAHGNGWAVTAAIVFGIAPDLSLLVGMDPRLGHGQLHPRAVPLYNAGHRLVGPLATIGLAVAFGFMADGGLAGVTWAAGLAWLTHVLVDRACGYGLRDRNGWQRG